MDVSSHALQSLKSIQEASSGGEAEWKQHGAEGDGDFVREGPGQSFQGPRQDARETSLGDSSRKWRELLRQAVAAACGGGGGDGGGGGGAPSPIGAPARIRATLEDAIERLG